MAGIGFELRKLFSERGILSMLKAYGYAGVVCVGPMLLGMVLLLGIRVLAQIGNASIHTQELLTCMITYTLLLSLIVTSIFSMITTRYTADAIYTSNQELVMPSFHGSIALMIIIGCPLYGIFLLFSGASGINQILCLILYSELVIVWTEINYLTAIKDYKSILLTFVCSIIVVFGIGLILIKLGLPTIPALLGAVTIGYGFMMICYYILLARYFPPGEGSAFRFLKWFSEFPLLAPLGFFMTLGLYTHIISMWFSPLGVQIEGLFYAAPTYDVPAIIAFLSILITTISFVTSVEVSFYPKYRKYYDAFNDESALVDIMQAEHEMKTILKKELSYTFAKQFFATIVFIIIGTIALPLSGLGFDEEMLGIYRVLCVGYAFYAIGNTTMLILLYFDDVKGAFISVTAFFVTSTIISIIVACVDTKFTGFGFIIGGAVFTMTSLVRLAYYIDQLIYRVLCYQPMIIEEKQTMLTKVSNYFDQRYKRKYEG